VAVVLTPVQTKQIRINIHKTNSTKNKVQTVQSIVNTSTHITKTPTQLSEQPYIKKTQTYTQPHRRTVSELPQNFIVGYS
jgi:hypothetical protein